MRLLRLLTLVGSLARLRRLGPLAFGKSLLGPMSLLGLLASSPAARRLPGRAVRRLLAVREALRNRRPPP